MSMRNCEKYSFVDFDIIFAAIRDEGFQDRTISLVDNYTNQILNGKTNLAQFNQAEHAGLCCAGEVLIGAYLVCNYAQASLATSADAGTCQAVPASWEIDELQERLVQQWAEAKQVWFANADADGLISTQPYIGCERLATKREIDQMLLLKGFRDNCDGLRVNYIGDRLHLEDMHPANVFVDTISSTPVCIDCIVKFIRKQTISASSALSACEKENTRLSRLSRAQQLAKILCNLFEFS